MIPTHPIELLIAHDRWATRQILAVCTKLTPEQFHQRFEMGPGSLHDTLLHMIAAKRTWTQTLAGVELTPRIDQDGQRRTPEQLLELLEDASRAFSAESVRRPLEEMATRVRAGQTWHLSRSAILLQVTTHGFHHRAQCLNMLRHLGVDPLPPSSMVEWIRLGATA